MECYTVKNALYLNMQKTAVFVTALKRWVWQNNSAICYGSSYYEFKASTFFSVVILFRVYLKVGVGAYRPL